MRRLSIYLAGPEVFLPDAVEIGRRKKALCDGYGFDGLFPFDNEIVKSEKGKRIDHVIYAANLEMLRKADIGIFNLTPFRGLSADVGTVFELGAMVGLAKHVFGYSNDPDDLLTRMRNSGLAVPRDPHWLDQNGMTIEDYSNADNLMIDAAFESQGHRIVRRSVAEAERFRDLAGFEECLRAAQAEFSIRQRAVAY
ncbi:MAG: hypothetical protein QOC72_3934 [Methylobacteriaceae bacterium]|jgi:nucleoside 2-deoxyribosyltransferase|nr:hypothetical protein [Methylobacteriaceae bacterium]